MSRITLTLETALGAKLKQKAEEEDRSMSSVARMALAKHFGISSTKLRRKKGASK